ncbi:MAG: hypothetical protein ABIQ56_02580 [Chitinophagaceae bacterium]
MKKCIIILLIYLSCNVSAQELFVSSEPASNMPAGSISMRVNSELSKMKHDGKWNSYRVDPEVMVGLSKKLMVHATMYGSNMFQSNYRVEGGSIYGKYRLFSSDDIHKHFRLAAFGKLSMIDNPVVLTKTKAHEIPDGTGGIIYHDIPSYHRSYVIDPEGMNSAVGGGLIATKLQNRLAISATAGYLYRLDNINEKKELFQPWHAINWSLSTGYLLLPKEYISYDQTNMNLYMEFLGQNSIDGKGYYVDVAPAMQFIFKSIARLDLGYQSQLTGKGERFHNSSFLVRVEYNFLNAF